MLIKILIFAIAVIFWIIKTARAAKEKKAQSSVQDVSTSVGSTEFESELTQIDEALQKDLKTIRHSYSAETEEELIDRALEENQGDLLSSVDYIKSAEHQRNLELHDRADVNEKGRFSDYAIKKKRKSRYAKMLSSKKGMKDAVILSEIISRKY